MAGVALFADVPGGPTKQRRDGAKLSAGERGGGGGGRIRLLREISSFPIGPGRSLKPVLAEAVRRRNHFRPAETIGFQEDSVTAPPLPPPVADAGTPRVLKSSLPMNGRRGGKEVARSILISFFRRTDTMVYLGRIKDSRRSLMIPIRRRTMTGAARFSCAAPSRPRRWEVFPKLVLRGIGVHAEVSFDALGRFGENCQSKVLRFGLVEEFNSAVVSLDGSLRNY